MPSRTAAIGLGDLGRVRGLGLVELIAAAAALLVSIASFSGMYREAPADDPEGIDTNGITGDAGTPRSPPISRAAESAPGSFGGR